MIPPLQHVVNSVVTANPIDVGPSNGGPTPRQQLRRQPADQCKRFRFPGSRNPASTRIGAPFTIALWLNKPDALTKVIRRSALIGEASYTPPVKVPVKVSFVLCTNALHALPSDAVSYHESRRMPWNWMLVVVGAVTEYGSLVGITVTVQPAASPVPRQLSNRPAETVSNEALVTVESNCEVAQLAPTVRPPPTAFENAKLFVVSW
jgi:hypothetical protein